MNRRKFLLSLVTLSAGATTLSLSETAAARANRAARHHGAHHRADNRSAFHSVGGVRRRTRRRTRRRVYRNMTLYSLPYGCSVTRVRAGVSYYHCGGIWYRPAYQGTTVIYIVEDIDSGADTNVEFED